MKKLLLLALLAAPLYAQTTTYTGTVKDLNGGTVTSGRITWTLNAPSGAHIPGIGAFVASTVSCLINASGSPVSATDGTSPCTIVNNTAMTPTGTSYVMCIQPNNVTPGSCITTFALGGTVDISTIVPTPATQPSYGLVTAGTDLHMASGTFTGPLSGTSATFTGSVLTPFVAATAGITGLTSGVIFNPLACSATVSLGSVPTWCSGTTPDTWLQSANDAAVATGNGGIVDARGLTGAYTVNQAGPNPLHSGDPTGSGVNVTWLLPATATWNLYPTNSSACGITEYGGSHLQGAATSGLGSKMIVSPVNTTGTFEALVCSDPSSNVYITNQNFLIANNQASGIQFINGLVWFHGLIDGSVWDMMVANNHFGDAMHVDVACCGTSFTRSDITVQTDATGGIPLKIGSGYTMFNAVVTSGSATVTVPNGTLTSAYLGLVVSDGVVNIPSGATVTAINSSTSLTMSAVATGSATETVNIKSAGTSTLRAVKFTSITLNRAGANFPSIMIPAWTPGSGMDNLTFDNLYLENNAALDTTTPDIYVGAALGVFISGITHGTPTASTKPVVRIDGGGDSALTLPNGVSVAPFYCGAATIAVQDLVNSKTVPCVAGQSSPWYSTSPFVSSSLNQQSTNVLADTAFNLGMWTQVSGSTGLSITAGNGAYGGNTLTWTSSGSTPVRYGYYQVVPVTPGEVLSLYGYVNSANASNFSGLGWSLKPTGSEGGTTVYCSSQATSNGFVGWTTPCTYTVPNSGVTQVSVVGSVGIITVPSGQSVYLSNPMLSFGPSAAPFTPGVFKGLQGAAGNLLAPANLGTGTPASGKYLDGTGAWVTLPTAQPVIYSFDNCTGAVCAAQAANIANQTMVSSVPGTNGVEYTFKGDIEQASLGTSCTASSVKVAITYTPQDTGVSATITLGITPSTSATAALSLTASTSGNLALGAWSRTITAKSGTAITFNTNTYTATGCSPNWTYTVRPLLVAEYQMN